MALVRIQWYSYFGNQILNLLLVDMAVVGHINVAMAKKKNTVVNLDIFQSNRRKMLENLFFNCCGIVREGSRLRKECRRGGLCRTPN